MTYLNKNDVDYFEFFKRFVSSIILDFFKKVQKTYTSLY